ncbi:MAG TPA: FliH/SctL family protein [bacterium]|nr:FliH/SctL family protein [bacterium]
MTSKIIKGGKGSGGTAGASHGSVEIYPEEGGVVHKRVLDARGKAEAILAAANDEAERIRREAEAVLEKARHDGEAAVKKGYAEGESKGLAQVTEKLLNLERLRERFYDQAEPEMIELVMSIAEKVIGRIASENPELIRSVVRQALERTLGDRITVSLNPEDYVALMAGEHEFKDVLDRTKRLMFREDDSVSKGGCVVETEVGTIDARIETQLQAIRKALVS